MKHDILQFVSDILSNDKLTHIDKQRIIELAKRDVQAFSFNTENLNDKVIKVEEKIEVIEEKIGLKNESKLLIEDQKPPNANKLPKYINPFSSNGLVSFLQEYNTNDFLKYTWHTIDSKQAYENILNLIELDDYNFILYKEKIEINLNELFARFFISGKVKNILLDYITGKDYNGNIGNWTKEMKINWSSDDLIQWSIQNKIVTNPGGSYCKVIKSKGYKLKEPIISKLSGKRINYFSELIIYCKKLFRIQADNSLRDILTYNNRNNNSYKSCTFNFIDFEETINLFTHINSIVEAYNIIIENILDVTDRFNLEKPIINISFITDINKQVNLIIHHENVDYFKKNINSLYDRNKLGEKYQRVIKSINGVCDLYLEAQFENNKSYRLNLWDNKDIQEKEINSLKGVKHILNFKA
jgi:hypothetical protein